MSYSILAPLLVGLVSAAGPILPRQTSASATVTAFENYAGNFQTTMATAAPSSGCAVISLTESTYTESYASVTTETITIPSGLQCTCAGGTIAGVSTSLITTVTPAVVQMYCQTGATGSEISAASTQSLAMETGSPNNPDWENVPCNYGSLATFAQSNPNQMWNDSGSSAAYQALTSSWDYAKYSAGNLTFSNYVSEFFNGPEPWFCDKLGNAGGVCDIGTTIACVEGASSQNGAVNSPAGLIIMDSFQEVHQVLDDFYTDITAANGYIGEQVDSFNVEFSITSNLLKQELAEEAQLKRIIGALLTVVNVLINFNLTVYLKTFVAIFKSGLNGNLISASSTDLAGLINQVWSQTELSFSTQDISYSNGAFSTFASVILEQWQDSAQSVTSSLFGDPAAIGGVINGGIALRNQAVQASPYNATQTLIAATFARLLSTAWAGGPTHGQPVIFSAEDNNKYSSSQAPSATSCDGSSPWDAFNSAMAGANKLRYSYNSKGYLNDATCFEVNGKPYWLVSLVPSSTQSGYFTGYLYQSPGVDSLNGTQFLYGGLAISDVVANAVNTYTANGNKNDFSDTAPANSFSNIASFESDGIDQILGLVQIPVCSAYDIANVLGADPSDSIGLDTWPCPNGTYDGTGGWTR